MFNQKQSHKNIKWIQQLMFSPFLKHTGNQASKHAKANVAYIYYSKSKKKKRTCLKTKLLYKNNCTTSTDYTEPTWIKNISQKFLVVKSKELLNMIIPGSDVLPIHCHPIDNRWCRLFPPFFQLHQNDMANEWGETNRSKCLLLRPVL